MFVKDLKYAFSPILFTSSIPTQIGSSGEVIAQTADFSVVDPAEVVETLPLPRYATIKL